MGGGIAGPPIAPGCRTLRDSALSGFWPVVLVNPSAMGWLCASLGTWLDLASFRRAQRTNSCLAGRAIAVHDELTLSESYSQCAVQPQSMVSALPVIPLASSEQR